MLVNEFELVNSDKVERVLKGAPDRDGNIVGGIEKPDGSFDEAELIAKYDKAGGLIRRNGDKVRMGSFWDFKAKKAKEVPEVVFEYRVNGKVVAVPDGNELPGIVKAAKMLDEEKKVVKKAKRGK